MVWPLRRPRRKTDVLAAQPPLGVGLAHSIHTVGGRLIVCNHVASVFDKEGPSQFPPLCHLGLSKRVAPSTQESQLCPRLNLAQVGDARDGGHRDAWDAWDTRHTRDVLRRHPDVVGLRLPNLDRLHGLFLDSPGLRPDIGVDPRKVPVAELVDHVEGPPRNVEAELGLATVMAVVAGGGAELSRTVEGQIGSAMGSVVTEPHDAPAVWPRHVDEGPGRAEHGDGPLPLPHDR
mmetsp:Transcript_29746/g.93798  ORF Transcript_29746/g.93798 Transcript_29746/m.93798 type:complete len:233 (+) Transcript_29746:392-1090(+)